VSLETKTDKHCQDIVKVLKSMMQEDGDSCYIGDIEEVVSRGEYRASEYDQRCSDIKVTNDIYDEIMDEKDQHDLCRWLSR
jgi:hypothetical protein